MGFINAAPREGGVAEPLSALTGPSSRVIRCSGKGTPVLLGGKGQFASVLGARVGRGLASQYGTYVQR